MSIRDSIKIVRDTLADGFQRSDVSVILRAAADVVDQANVVLDAILPTGSTGMDDRSVAVYDSMTDDELVKALDAQLADPASIVEPKVSSAASGSSSPDAVIGGISEDKTQINPILAVILRLILRRVIDRITK